jgi:hypothetical protein
VRDNAFEDLRWKIEQSHGGYDLEKLQKRLIEEATKDLLNRKH